MNRNRINHMNPLMKPNDKFKMQSDINDINTKKEALYVLVSLIHKMLPQKRPSSYIANTRPILYQDNSLGWERAGKRNGKIGMM